MMLVCWCALAAAGCLEAVCDRIMPSSNAKALKQSFEGETNLVSTAASQIDASWVYIHKKRESILRRKYTAIQLKSRNVHDV